MIDLRSDTVTAPTEEMRRAMARAEVGDDVYGEDPTVRRLEEKAAELVGKEASLFFASGTMANQVAIKLWSEPGQQFLVESQSHIVLYELAATTLISAVAPYLVSTESGSYGAEVVEARLAAAERHGATRTRLVCVENSHNRAGGRVFPPDKLKALGEFCRARDLKIHMDGARVFNAAAALGKPAAEVTAAADSVMFCLSKGLACPVGSMLAGPSDFIAEARRWRQLLGGGMRQSGVLAAAGLLSLGPMVERLGEDHGRAQRLARGLQSIDGVALDPAEVETNIVNFGVAAAQQVVDGLAEHGVLCFAIDTDLIRIVIHYQISDADIDATIEAVASVLSSRTASV